MSSFRSKPELVKLFYRIGEVANIVGVQPHVLRYWETEFRTIRPQKSNKGQRIYSRRDVEKLIKVKDLLRNQGFTIAGARKVMRDQPEGLTTPSVPEEALLVSPTPSLAASDAVQVLKVADIEPLQEAAPLARSAMITPPLPSVGQPERSAKRLRKALVELRQEVVSVLADLPPGGDNGSN